MSGQPTSLADAILGGMNTVKQQVNTTMPGILVDFDSLTQTATIQPAVKRQLFNDDGESSWESLPLLSHVPVMFFFGGGYVMTVPLQAGDTVLLVFTQQGLAEFRATGKESETWDSRRHHISGAVAIPGLHADTAPFASGDSGARAAGILIGRDGSDEQIRITSGSIKLGASATDFVALAPAVFSELQALRATLNALVTSFNLHAHDVNVLGVPVPTSWPGQTNAGAASVPNLATPPAAVGPVAATLVKAK